MTEKQIKLAQKNAKFGTKEYEELSCREMINSCLAYGEMYHFFDEKTKRFVKYGKKYEERLGYDDVFRIMEEQKADFAKAIVRHNVYVDCEGVSYNSIIWEDEL